MPAIRKVILVVDASRSYGRGLLKGIARYSHLHGPWALYTDPTGGLRLSQSLKDWGGEGIIVFTKTGDERRLQRIVSLELPIVLAGPFLEQAPNLPHLVGNAERIGRLAADHFIERGFCRFAYVGMGKSTFAEQRKVAFLDSIAQAGFQDTFYEGPETSSRLAWEQQQAILLDWLKPLPKPIALMACNDYRGQQVSEACKAGAIAVPEEVALIGVGDDEILCSLCDPPLSSIALNSERAGYDAAKLLDSLMAGQRMVGQKIVVEPASVVTRQSTDIFAIADKGVVAALRFIENHSKRAMQVSDVLEAVPVSRRTLEMRFGEFLGRSVHEQIKHARVREISRMLVETDLSITQIALTLGFTDGRHISRYFREATGTTPIDYRKMYGV